MENMQSTSSIAEAVPLHVTGASNIYMFPVWSRTASFPVFAVC